MKIALDPYMHRHLSLEALCRATKDMGLYSYMREYGQAAE